MGEHLEFREVGTIRMSNSGRGVLIKLDGQRNVYTVNLRQLLNFVNGLFPYVVIKEIPVEE